MENEQSPRPSDQRHNSLTSEELGEFRQALLKKREELIRGMSTPCGDKWEQEFTSRFGHDNQLLLYEVDAALQRIDDNTYGFCVATNKAISKDTLRAIPWTRLCIEYAKEREAGLP